MEPGELESFLLEITYQIFHYVDEKTGLRLIDEILDKAKQKGTGKWTSQDAMDLQVPVPTIDMAVSMRDLSGYKAEREASAKSLSGPEPKLDGDKKAFIQQLHNALFFGMIATYSQGMALLKTASQAYNYGLQLHEVARIWRGGCIIRARLLEDIRQALKSQPDLPNLILDGKLAAKCRAATRRFASGGADCGRIRHSLAGAHGLAGLLRRVPQWLVACQPDSGST